MNQLSEYFIKEIEKKEDEQKTFIAPKSKNMNINQIIDEDEDDSFFNLNNNNINNFNKSKSINPLDEDNNFLSRTQLFPHKFQKNESLQESNISLQNNLKEEFNDINQNNNDNILPKKEPCPKHKKEPIEYYCLNCNTKHCAKCLLIMSKESKLHQGHIIFQLHAIRQKKHPAFDPECTQGRYFSRFLLQ